MKILKSTLLKKRRCEFGNFELVPDAGWDISQAFIDFASGLLIVTESDENKENWSGESGTKFIPTREHKVDTRTGEILTFEGWSKFFSYEPREFISKDGKYKLITTRIYDPNRNSDGIKEELLDLASGKSVSSSYGVAFREKPRENLLEAHYRQTREKKERQRKVDALPTLLEFYQSERQKLTAGTIIAEYYDPTYMYQLRFNGDSLVLSRCRQKWNPNLEWSTLAYDKWVEFADPEGFSAAFLTQKEWYLQHTPFTSGTQEGNPNQLLKRFVIEFLNELRRRHDFTFAEYVKLNTWENFYYQPDSVKPGEYQQFCPNCGRAVRYFPRYPKYICGECASKKITDEEGTELAFSNVGMSGGLRITYIRDGVVIKEDTSQLMKRCFIDGKPFVATEARFGGIVIQPEPESKE